MKEKGMDRSVEAGHTMFVRCRIVTATALMRCRLESRGQCIIVDKKNTEYCKLVPRDKSDVFVASVIVYNALLNRGTSKLKNL